MTREVRLALALVAFASSLVVASACRRDTTPSSPRAEPPRPAAAVPAEPTARFRVPVQGAPARGSDQPKITIVQFIDYACPHCARVNQTLIRLLGKYPRELRLVSRHRASLTAEDSKAMAAAAEAAGAQGRFWPFHDRLLAARARGVPVDRAIEETVRELDLDRHRFERDRAGVATLRRIEEDRALSDRLGVAGVPFFFVNGRPMRGNLAADTFEQVIGEELREADARLARGTKPADVYDFLVAGAPDRASGPLRLAEPAPPVKLAPGQYAFLDIEGAPTRGPADARVTLVQFSDFECPFCQRGEATLRKLEQTFPGDVRIVWRDLPLAMHEYAVPAALAGRAAHAQGKFWPMQRALFTGRADLTPEGLEQMAAGIGLDLVKFRRVVADPRTLDGVEADRGLAWQYGIKAVPAFFVNGRYVAGALPFDEFRAIVEEELGKARKLEGEGVARAAIYSTLRARANRAM